jgi:hypothetical protein
VSHTEFVVSLETSGVYLFWLILANEKYKADYLVVEKTTVVVGSKVFTGAVYLSTVARGLRHRQAT